MNNKWMPKIMLNYRSNGRRQIGRPLKRLLDEAKTGLSRPNSCQMMMMMMTNAASWQCFDHFMKVKCSFSSAHILCWHNAIKCPHITFILTWCNQLPTHQLHNCSSIYSALLVRCNLEFHKLSYKSSSKISTKYYKHDCDWETTFKIPFLNKSYCSIKLVNQTSIACLCAIHYTPHPLLSATTTTLPVKCIFHATTLLFFKILSLSAQAYVHFYHNLFF